MRVSISFRLKPPRIWPKSNPHHHIPPMIARRITTEAPRPHQGRCVRTAMRGAEMPKCRRTRRHQAGIVNLKAAPARP